METGSAPQQPPGGAGVGGEAIDVAQARVDAPESSPTSPTTSRDGPSEEQRVEENSTASVVTPGVRSTASVTSDRQPSHGTLRDPADRVFPMRSVVSVDPGRTSGEYDYFNRPLSDEGASPAIRIGSLRAETDITRRGGMASDSTRSGGTVVQPPNGEPGGRRRRKNGALSSMQADADRQGSVPPMPSFTEDEVDEDDGSDDAAPWPASQATENLSEAGGAKGTFTTTRFKHVLTDEGHAVITGREGTLQRCEDEPIHTPGAVQGFGLLLAIREEPDGKFSVRYASENAQRIIGYTPQELFRLDNFTDILSDEQAENLLDHIDFIEDEDADPSTNGPEVFGISIRPPGKKRVKLWCAMHINPAHPGLIICEFELDDDHDFPLRPADDLTPDVPEDTLQANPTREELTESTEILSKPLRVLRSARKRRGEPGAMQVFDILSQVQDQLAAASGLEGFLKILVGIVKELTGFHRVMIYQFDSSFNGKVVTELVDPIRTKDLYKGLHFPAADIPKQARELYKINKVRLLYDRDLETARIVCRSAEDLDVPLDMTHAYLRAMSPIHLKYLGNMAVRASMSISVNAFNELWGLIACHSYGAKGMRVSFPIRKMCRLVGDNASRNIERLSYASRLQARKLINTMPTDKNPSGYIIASSDDLLKLFDADFGMLCIRGETKILGKVDDTQEVLAMLEYLRLRKFTSVVTSQDIKMDFPDLRYGPGFSVIAGLLYVPLSVGGSDFIVFFRRGQIREVKWAGNPYSKIIKEGTSQYLEPRKSFKTWHETVIGKCREWSEEQVETSAVLCLVYGKLDGFPFRLSRLRRLTRLGKFIEVWRQKEAALRSSRLTRLLLANSAHEVRTPLNAIINYLEIALEGSLDQETRDNLAKSHSASKSLIYVINDLLDLTQTEEGQELIKDEIFDLPACIHEATEPFENDAKRKGISYEAVVHPGLPQFVFGDQRRVRQAVANITANAVQHTPAGSVNIEMYVVEVQDRRVRVEIAVQDTGRGMNNAMLDSLFRDLEQVTSEADDSGLFGEPEKAVPDGARTLGLGLAVVARIVRNMDGQLRLKSEEGKGSRFIIQLPFELPPSDEPEPPEGLPSTGSAGNSSVTTVSTTCPPSHEGEVTLVERGSALPSGNAAVLVAKKSAEDVKSVKSHRSGASKGSARSNVSDADRLIDAIQTPLALDEHDSGGPPVQRQRSRGAYHASHRRNVSGAASPTRSTSPKSRATRPVGPSRAASSPGKDAPSSQDGLQFVTDTRTPIRPVRISDDSEYRDMPGQPQQATSSGILFELKDQPRSSGPKPHGPKTPTGNKADARDGQLEVLIAEDDPVNFKLLSKRLEKAGHMIFHALNGEDCAQTYRERSKDFDVVLMDMQVRLATAPVFSRVRCKTDSRRRVRCRSWMVLPVPR